MKRKIITIDEQKCNGCGACADACHEGAIGMVDGKAKLLRDDYCDGLGNCLPVCPTGAISFEEREAAAYDEAAVKANQAAGKGHGKQNYEQHDKQHGNLSDDLPCGCPGTQSRRINHGKADAIYSTNAYANACSCGSCEDDNDAPAHGQALPQTQSQLSQWPVQIKLVPVNAPYFDNANLLVAADCTAYAYGDFHNRFIRNRITLIGCPKLDQIDYTEKLTAIIRNNNIRSVTVVRMEVPCCGGIEYAVRTALQTSGKFIPWRVVTISTDGQIIDEE